MRTFICVFVLFCSIAFALADSHNSVGDANGHYDGVPTEWTCNHLWFNEYERIKSGYYEQYRGRNLTKLFDAPIGTEIPSLGVDGTWGCDCGCGVWDPDCAHYSRSTGSASDSDLLRMWCSSDRADAGEIDPQLTICQAIEDRSLGESSKHATCTTVPQRAIGVAPDPSYSENWFCEPNFYNEASTGSSPRGGEINCDCGCGAYDPDCDLFQAESAYKLTISCGRDLEKEATQDKICIRGVAQCLDVPAGWTCDAHLYDEKSRSQGNTKPTCDCFCGEWDPDCDDQGSASPLPLNCGDNGDSSSVAFCSKAALSCVNSPQNWLCSPARWAERYHQVDTDSYVPVCDCGCGDWDPDCDLNIGHTFVTSDGGLDTVNKDIAIRCLPSGSAFHRATDGHRYLCKQSDFECQSVPDSWICTPRWYNEFGTGSTGTDNVVDCDCGCGILDPDCKINNSGDKIPLFCSNVAPAADDGPQKCYEKKVEIKRADGYEKETWGVCD